MAMKCSQEAILNFLRQRGGRVPNTELVEHFKSIFPSDPKKKAAVRELFKGYVDSVAYVKTENGVKHVCLKKKFREDTLNQEKSHDGTPKSSREHFLEVMMCSSPQVRLNIDLRRLSRSDSDSASISSCNLEEDRNSATLDPLEHEWMMCASDAEWGSLQRLLNDDPGLVLKKDFVTGFTCLHWAAKQGKPELIALIINFAKQHNVPVSVDVRSSTGYTPLHLAAMHSHMDVVKLLVGAYNADVEVRDYSGRKACQYLTDNVSVDIRDIIGAYEIETENKPASAGKRWRFNKVLQVKPLRRLNSTGDSDTLDGGAREAPLRRRSSLSRMKPKLQKLKWRTSQLVHSSTFHGAEDLEKRKARPKTHYFG
uniref:SOWAHA-C winged helix-turn-helix domain-containing protein n=1 Tax=Periophthalmus magnuspinnatus TaxID=409849 RepID=A0A3B4AAK2_9GOBI